MQMTGKTHDIHESNFMKRIEIKEKLIHDIYNELNQPSTEKLWEIIREEGKIMAKEGFRSSALISSTLLMENSLADALIDILANELGTSLIPATQVRNIFSDVVCKNSTIIEAWTKDLISAMINDLSISSCASAMLFNKGFHSLVAYRIGNSLWYNGRDGLARYFQSLISRKFSSDLHPACSIGSHCYLSEGSDFVFGETSSVGDHCCFQQGVTLGGTGKEGGDRHPKVGNFAFFGIGVTVLGNIRIGDGSILNSLSVVTKPVEAYTRVGGIPAKQICTIDKQLLHERISRHLPTTERSNDMLYRYQHLHHMHHVDADTCYFI